MSSASLRRGRRSLMEACGLGRDSPSQSHLGAPWGLPAHDGQPRNWLYPGATRPRTPRSFHPFRAHGRDERRRARLGRWLRFRRASSVRHIVPRSHRTTSHLSILITQATQGNLSASYKGFAKLAFTHAGERYFDGRKLELGESSQKKERQLLVKPSEFFQQKSLSKITADDVLRFREWRSENGVGPAAINMEVGVIRRILKRAKRWHLIGAEIRPLKEPRSIGRALTFDEKLRLLRIAGQNDEWQRAGAAISIALCTAMRGCEIKRLQWRDIDFLSRTVLVRTSKTDAGQRLIPMNAEVYEIVIRLRERAKVFRGIDPQHHVFPACENGHVDPTRCQKSFRTAWRNLTRAIECPVCNKLQSPAEFCANKDCRADIRGTKSTLAGLRFHDLRHLAITELAESKFLIKPSWPSPVMSAKRCLLAIHTCGARLGDKRLRRSRQNRQGNGSDLVE